MSNVGESHEILSIGEQVADVQLTEKIGAGGGIHAWAGTQPDGRRVVVYALDGAMGPEARNGFLAAAAEKAGQTGDGVATIEQVDPAAGAYVASVDANGTLADLPILHWDQKRLIKLFRRICEIVGALHDQGIAHGWLRPENILLDTAFEPVVANVGTVDVGQLCRTDAGQVWIHRIYSPPEVRHGGNADQSADAFALGRILHFALLGEEPDEKDEHLPRLDALQRGDVPNAIIRIIRKCTTSDVAQRYDHAGEIVKELDRAARHVPVGMPHPDIDGKEESSMIDDRRMRSKPPPKKEKTGPAIAIEIRDASDGPRFWSIGIAIGLGLLGLTMLGVSIGVAYGTGSEAFALDVVMWASAIPLGFATPGFTSSRLLARLLTALVIGAILFFANPLELVRAQRTAGLQSPDMTEKVAAFKELVAGGITDFRDYAPLDLTGGDLSGMNLAGAALDGVILKNANLSKANLRNASMANADVSGADLSGANLSGVVGQWMTGLTLAKCTEGTQLPDGYTCQEGAPTPN